MEAVESEVESWHFPRLVEDLQTAAARGDEQMAHACWAEIRDRFPEIAMRSRPVLQALLDLPRFDDAEALMAKARALHPRDGAVAEGWAMVAQHRKDVSAAVERWALVRKKFRSRAAGYSQGAVCLIDAGRLDDADAVLRRGLKAFSEDLQLRMAHGRLAEVQGAWDVALDRWRWIRDNAASPADLRYEIGGIGVATCLRELGRLDEAEAVLLDLRPRRPLSIVPAMDLALIAEMRGDPEQAIERWTVVKTGFPLMQMGYVGLMRVLRSEARDKEAEHAFLEARDRFPDVASFAVDFAIFAENRQDWEEAVSRWEVVRARFPDREDGYVRGTNALLALGQIAGGEALRAEHARRFYS